MLSPGLFEVTYVKRRTMTLTERTFDIWELKKRFNLKKNFLSFKKNVKTVSLHEKELTGIKDPFVQISLAKADVNEFHVLQFILTGYLFNF